METSGLSVLSADQMELLLAIFKDCREFYRSRALFDRDFKSLSKVTLNELYDAWKGVNAFLVAADGSFSVSFLPNWHLTPASSAKEVRAYRQLVGIFSRLSGHCDTAAAVSSYKTRVANARGQVPKELLPTVKGLISSWLGAAPVLLDLHPKHGPGAVAERVKSPIDKQYFHVIYPQLFPYGGESLLYLHENHAATEPHSLVLKKHPITRVVAVPKDFMKPRVISCEPMTMQFLQQGLCRYLMGKLEATCPYVRFRDQSHNAMLARDLSVATLDMSDASDTVSRRIVWACFPDDWKRLLFALRSHFASIDDELIPLRAFAPMGSALCFPVESVIFAAVTVASIIVDLGIPYLKANKAKIAVYGDDIIVPIEASSFVLTRLESSGFIPNKRKCCVKGSFRESCGAEWYNGYDVTVVRPRTLSPFDTYSERFTPLTAMPMAQHAKSLHDKGFSCAATLLASKCCFPVAIGNGEGYMPAALPWKQVGRTRWNPHLQRLEQQALLPVQVSRPSDAGTGYSALFMHLSFGWSSEQVSMPRVKPKNRWVLAAPLSER